MHVKVITGGLERQQYDRMGFEGGGHRPLLSLSISPLTYFLVLLFAGAHVIADIIRLWSIRVTEIVHLLQDCTSLSPVTRFDLSPNTGLRQWKGSQCTSRCSVFKLSSKGLYPQGMAV